MSFYINLVQIYVNKQFKKNKLKRLKQQMKQILNELSEMQGKKIDKRTKKKTGIMSSTLSMQHELIKHQCRVFPSSLIVIALRSSVIIT